MREGFKTKQISHVERTIRCLLSDRSKNNQEFEFCCKHKSDFSCCDKVHLFFGLCMKFKYKVIEPGMQKQIEFTCFVCRKRTFVGS